MDNASKALVMAGAVLIAVMLISLGVVLFNSAADVGKDSTQQLDSLAVETYNSGYVQLTGPKVSASTARSMITKIRSHNGNTTEVGKYGTITLSGTTSVGAIDDNKFYKVDVTGYTNPGGAISTVSISVAS